MNKLVKCLNKYRKRQATFVSLQEALVSNRIANYGFFRFRFAALSTLLSLGAHILEFLILSSVFSFGDFSALFLLRTIAIFCRSSWWGMLEVLRARIRVLYADRELLEIRQAIVHWMLLAGSISLLICIIAMGLYFFIPKVSMASTIFKLYFLVILIEIAIQLLVSTFHAGLYAVKRIPRPFLSIAVTDILAVIFVLLLPDEERVYTLPVSLLFSSILSGGLSAYYTARAYRDVNFFPWLWPTVQTFYYFLKSIRHKELVFAGLASTMFSMDVVILNVLIMTHVSTKDTYKIVIILYLLESN